MFIAVIVLVAFFLFLLAVFEVFIDSTFGGLDFSTKKPVVEKIIGLVKEHRLENGKFYDLGSAQGGLVIKLAKALPKLQITGIDDNKLRVILARARTYFFKNVKFWKQNIFTTNISQADIVYLYLPVELMAELEVKIQRELKPGGIAITHKVSFPNWAPVQKLDEIFIYRSYA